jgi:hypothetical protein
MFDASGARSPRLEVLACQRTIDSERGACAFRGRDDHELNVFDNVAGHEDTPDARGLVLSALDPAMSRELAPQ